MADVTTAAGAAPISVKPSTSTSGVVKTAKKAAKVKKAVQPALHPKYRDMIASAIASLKERGGSSRQAILKYISAHYKVGSQLTRINASVKMALRAGIKAGTLKQAKGTGASGSFRLGEKPKAAAKPKTAGAKKPKAAAKKPASKKGKTTPKKSASGTKKVAAKKSKSAASAKKPSKSPKKALVKKTKAKSPKKLAKPKAAKKTPAKKSKSGKMSKK